jgi:uncharacterized membrane protein HdeD (DUF308 family)
MIILGIISIIGGLLALANPFAATLTVVALAGWFFIVFGVIQIIHSFALRGWGGFLWALIFGLVMLALGISLLKNPIAGMMSLTMLVAILFLISGVAKLFYAFSWRPASGWVLALLSGLISIILAIMIFANFPQSAAIMLGILLAIELLSNGVFLLMGGWFVRQA